LPIGSDNFAAVPSVQVNCGSVLLQPETRYCSEFPPAANRISCPTTDAAGAEAAGVGVAFADVSRSAAGSQLVSNVTASSMGKDFFMRNLGAPRLQRCQPMARRLSSAGSAEVELPFLFGETEQPA
jgi:hypothetical protein